MSRVPANFEDCDLFNVHFAPQTPKNDGFTEFGTQTSSIVASDCSTQTVVAVDGGTQTSSTETETNTTDEGKENDASLDHVAPFLNKNVSSMERELMNNTSSTAFKNYPDQSSSMFGGSLGSESAEEFVTLQAPLAAAGLSVSFLSKYLIAV